MAPPQNQLLVARLGLLPYAEALDFQRAVARARITGAVPEDVLLIVEHPPVVTLGRRTQASSLPFGADLLRARGVEVFEVERGGDVTLHAPGQLVGYPVVDLKRHRKDLHWYLRQVEAGLIDGIAPFGLAGVREAGYTGVWAERAGGRRKLASIGVHARDWVTWHGFALNVTEEPLRYFDLIVPCGIAGVEMTSVSREAGRAVTVAQVAREVVRGFGRAFDLVPVTLTPGELRERLDTASSGTANADTASIDTARGVAGR